MVNHEWRLTFSYHMPILYVTFQSLFDSTAHRIAKENTHLEDQGVPFWKIISFYISGATGSLTFRPCSATYRNSESGRRKERFDRLTRKFDF
jgi:hypothetical protein